MYACSCDFSKVSIQMEAFYQIEKCLAQTNNGSHFLPETEGVKRQDIARELGFEDDPITFFGEMCQVLSEVPSAIIGKETWNTSKATEFQSIANKNRHKFEKYLCRRWKELKKLDKKANGTDTLQCKRINKLRNIFQLCLVEEHKSEMFRLFGLIKNFCTCCFVFDKWCLMFSLILKYQQTNRNK
ncbi:hypothetical protein RFI_03282 [Reticulomyxa filosa]|uniref:Uncharacterized protein n=1 Tax=Reticulomyxa filosa TaxID=46433 RepID=X6P6L6_RETFI|nr:hypothetical protein RFI_03282 [Reticulomyxa filosa]|eukprot:ETO33821.1 hypothetical protein RFI_03282 [Reticulomyxa filosa]